jgi:nucleoside-diphosphate-sugar epimerase
MLFRWLTTNLENSGKTDHVDLDMKFPDGLDGHGLKYQASKILAHQASLDFVQKHHPHFTLITLHPTFVLGPSLVQKSAEDISGVNMMFMETLKINKPLFPATVVDVRDVAKAAIGTIDAKVEGNGEEFIISGSKTNWDEILAYVKSAHPDLPIKLQPPFAKPFVADAAKAERVLGASWRSTNDIIGSVLDQQLALSQKSKA